uniref:Integrase catalytic domain-containing protein n=1 Tax=Strigamia maritima TaxID=126957 RepID=T1IJB0_STRMM
MTDKDITRSVTSGIIKLDRLNYVQWAIDVRLLLEEKGVWDFAEGKEVEPLPTATGPEKLKFLKDKAKSRTIILQSLVPRLQPAAMRCLTTKDVWDHLKKLFEPSCIAREASLVEKFYGIHRFDNEELDTFISRLEKAKDDLVAANDKLKPVDHVKAYILLSRVGKDFELQIQSIYQWAKDAFTYAKDQPQQDQPQQRGRGQGRGKRRGGRRIPGVSAEGHPTAAAWFANAPGAPVVPDQPQVCAASVDMISAAWYLDSCASHHVCGQREMFSTFEELKPMRLELGEGSSAITGRGTVVLIVQVNGGPFTIELLNVYYVKNFKHNLISLGKIDSAKYHIAIYNHSMKVFKCDSRVCSLYGVLEDGLYRIQGPVKYRQSNVTSLSKSSLTKSGNCVTEPSSANKPENYVVSVNMWHQRFGHMYTKGLNHLVNNTNVKGIDLKSKVSKSICDNCELSKSTRAGFKSESLLVASEPLELLHMDFWGPCPIPSLGEARYLFCIVDDATRYTWIHPLRSKDQVFETYKRFHMRIERMSGKKIKAIRTDRGGEFTSGEFESFLASLGVRIQRTNSYSPEMNGVAERVNRTVLNSIRAMLLGAGLPKPLWAELAITLVYLKNRYPHSRLSNAIPYVLFMKRPVSVAHLRIPGFLAYVHVPKPSRSDKLEPRAWKGVMVGYAMGTRGFRVWDPISGGVFESKHVKFDEVRLYKDVVKTHVRDSPFQTEFGQSSFKPSSNESSDSEDEAPPPIAPRPARIHMGPPPVAQPQETPPPPAAQKFATQDIPPFVSTRKKDFSVAMTPLRPTRVAHRVPVPHKPGWEREEVQRQTGATKGQWDVYYYAPGLRTALHSRPDIKAWCEVHLKEKYKASVYDFNPAHAADSDNENDPEQPRTEETETELKPAVDDESTETYAVRVYCASVQEPSTFEEAMSSPESDEWRAAMDEELDTLEERSVFEIKPRPSHSHIL